MKKQMLIFMASMALTMAAKASSISYADSFTEPVNFNQPFVLYAVQLGFGNAHFH
jgi:hypothetical protein